MGLFCGEFALALSGKWSEVSVGLQGCTLPDYQVPVCSVAFSPDAKWIVSASDAGGSHEGLVKIWNATTGAEVRSFVGVL